MPVFELKAHVDKAYSVYRIKADTEEEARSKWESEHPDSVYHHDEVAEFAIEEFSSIKKLNLSVERCPEEECGRIGCTRNLAQGE